MTSMIEKVAQAIREVDEDSSPLFGRSYTELARAAIAAMREPTEAMLFAGGRASLPAAIPSLPIWQAMIDAALDPHPLHDDRSGDGDHPGDNPA